MSHRTADNKDRSGRHSRIDMLRFDDVVKDAIEYAPPRIDSIDYTYIPPPVVRLLEQLSSREAARISTLIRRAASTIKNYG
jgi:hypothetical protein